MAMLIVRILAFLFVVFVVYRLARRLLKGIFFSTSFGTDRAGTREISDMAQDPVCGSYVSRDHAVSGDFFGKKFYFCSKTCFEKYRGLSDR